MSGQQSPTTGNGDLDTDPTSPRTTADAPDVVRRMAARDRATHPVDAHAHPAGSTASADAVDQVRRSLNDLKHDVRMVKVGLDKQGLALERLVASIERLADDAEE